MAEQGVARRKSQGEGLLRPKEELTVYRRKSQWDVPRKYSRSETERRASILAATQKPGKSDIMERSNKKHSVANAVAVIGVTEALLIGSIV